MIRKKILKKQGLSLDDIQIVKLSDKGRARANALPEHGASNSFTDTSSVSEALFQRLIDNNPEAFMEIIEALLEVNKKSIAHKASLSRALQEAFSWKGNPTLKTIAKIVHQGVKNSRKKYVRVKQDTNNTELIRQINK